MVLVYIDDILHFDHIPSLLMEQLKKIYRLKDKAKVPERLIGTNIERVQLKDGTMAWSMSSHKYLRNTIENLEKELQKEDRDLR